MADTNANKATGAVAETKKVVRRGVAAARGTTRLKFSHELANRMNGLFLGHLEDVKVSTITIGEDKTGMPSFNGCEIPKIVFTFASNEEDANKRRYVTLQFTAVESNTNTIPGGKEEWKVNTVFDWFKHLLNVYVLKGREMTEDEDAALSLPFADFDEQGEYVPVNVEEVIAGWKSLFENFENVINRGRDNQPYYTSAKDGKFISIWMKLIRCTKTKKGWTNINNGDLAFPAFVGEGCIELFKQNVAPSIRVDAVRESIIPMVKEQPKTPNMPTANQNNMMGGVPVGDPMMGGMQGFETTALDAGDDMPF